MFQDIGGPIYGVILLVVVALLYRGHTKKDFNLLDLLMEKGHISKIAVAYLTTLFTSSWYIVHEAIEKQLTDTAFGAYLAAWVIPIVARIIKDEAPAIQQQEKTV